jgi:hypothetical protein
MSRYLDRLKALAGEKHYPERPSKPSKGGYDGFDGSQGGRFSRATPIPTYDPDRLQAQVDRRNREAASNHSTDRSCRCGHLATFAWLGDDGGSVWICAECLPTRGRA